MTVALGTTDPDRWTFTGFFDEFVVSPDVDAGCAQPSLDDSLSSPHSASFVDLDGDCRPDILLTRVGNDRKPYLEVYI